MCVCVCVCVAFMCVRAWVRMSIYVCVVRVNVGCMRVTQERYLLNASLLVASFKKIFLLLIFYTSIHPSIHPSMRPYIHVSIHAYQDEWEEEEAEPVAQELLCH